MPSVSLACNLSLLGFVDLKTKRHLNFHHHAHSNSQPEGLLDLDLQGMLRMERELNDRLLSLPEFKDVPKLDFSFSVNDLVNERADVLAAFQASRHTTDSKMRTLKMKMSRMKDEAARGREDHAEVAQMEQLKGLEQRKEDLLSSVARYREKHKALVKALGPGEV